MTARDQHQHRVSRGACRSKVLKLRKRIVLTISSAGTSTIATPSHAIGLACSPSGIVEHRRGDQARGRRDSACRRSSACRCCAWMLKRARRSAAAVTNRKPTAQPEPAERRQAPRKRENRRRHAERDDVGQRIELHAELAGRAGHPRDAAVEHVEHDREADERRRGLELAAHRVDDAGVAAEHVAQREQAGQQRHAAPDAAAIVTAMAPACSWNSVACRAASWSSTSFTAPASRSSFRRRRPDRPTFTRIVARARQEHVHPRAELHHAEAIARPRPDRPACTRQTMRRARMPTICRTTIGPPGVIDPDLGALVERRRLRADRPAGTCPG